MANDLKKEINSAEPFQSIVNEEMIKSLKFAAEMGKILYDECKKQGFSENQAIKFVTLFLNGGIN